MFQSGPFLSPKLDMEFDFDFSNYKFNRKKKEVLRSTIKKDDKMLLSQLMTEVENSGYFVVMQGGIMYTVLLSMLMAVLLYKIKTVVALLVILCIGVFCFRDTWRIYLW